MIATAIALLFAHAFADFLLQPRWMIDQKKRPGIILLHGAIVLLTAQLALGQIALPILVLAAIHLLIDTAKTYLWNDRLTAYLTDQTAHILTIAGIAYCAPTLWKTGVWATNLPDDVAPLLLHAMVLAAGLILITRAGGFAIVKLMEAHALSEPETDEGLPGGGATIGHLERILIFVLILSGQIAAIGFLVAAKSVLRFGTVSGDRKATEYVIIGTLFSFGWAITLSLATAGLIALLPPLEITAPTP